MLRYCTPLSLTCWLIAGLASTALSDPYPCTHEKATIHGMIRDVDGTPVSQATVSFTGMVWDSTCRSATSAWIKATTDAKGTYVLTVPSGVGSLHVERSGHRQVLRWEELFAGDMVIDHRFVQYHVRGRVVAADSVQGEAMLTYYPDPGRGVGMCGSGLPEIRTAGRTFDITVDRAGRYLVAAWIPGNGASSWMPVGGEATASLFIHSDTTLTLDLGGDPVLGRVRGYAGLPQKLASVFAYGPNGSGRAFCDSAGQFQMRLPAGAYYWSVEPLERDVERWSSREAVDVGPRTVVDLDLDVVEWTGTARYEGSAETVPDVLVCVEEEGREGEVGVARCVTDRYGDFHLTVRRGVPHRLSVKEAASPPWRPQRVRALTVGGASSSTDSTFDIALERLWVPEPRRAICPSPAKSTIKNHPTGESHR